MERKRKKSNQRRERSEIKKGGVGQKGGNGLFSGRSSRRATGGNAGIGKKTRKKVIHGSEEKRRDYKVSPQECTTYAVNTETGAKRADRKKGFESGRQR